MSDLSRRVRVVLADDHDILRQGLSLLLSQHEDIEIVGDARTGSEAVQIAVQLEPDVVVLDISMPGMDGFEACRHIHSRCPATQVLILTMHESEEYFLQSLRAGAAGYVLKKAAPTELHAAICTVAAGGAFLYPGLAKALIRAYLTPPIIVSEAASEAGHEVSAGIREDQDLKVLTPRELEVLKLVAEGNTNQEIADRLVLSIKTVQAHRASVMEKLGLRDVTHLVRFALRHRLVAEGL